MPDWAKELSWLKVGSRQNPYPYEVLDCRAAVIALSGSIQEQTGSAALAGIEAAVKAPPNVYAPANGLSFGCSIVVPVAETAIETLPAVAAGDRWMLSPVGNRILVRRRWTGQVIHAADFTAEPGGFVVEQVISDRQSCHDNKDYALAEIDFILKSCVERTHPAFPIPPQFDRNDMARIAIYGWQTHGPLAQFGRRLEATK